MKKILIFLFINICIFSNTLAANIDSLSEKLFQSHQNENIFTQADIYEKYISQLQKIIKNNKKSLFLNNRIRKKYFS